MRKASAVLLFTLSLCLLSLQLESRGESSGSYYFNFNIAPMPEAPSTHDTVIVTVSFETNYIYAIPANFSSLYQSGNNYSVTIEIYPIHGPFPVTGYEEKNCSLGILSTGLYHFHADVQVWSAPPDDPFRMLLESESYSKSIAVSALTITVPDDYLTIQEAINGANEGDTIFVRNGTYHENVVVNKSVSLIGETRETTMVDGGGTGHAVSITGNNVTIAGFTIMNSIHSPPYSGIYLDNVRNSCILENAILSGYRGIWLQNASGNVVQDNIISNISNSLAIWLQESNDNVVLANLIQNCSSGFYIYYSDNCRVQNNYVANITYYGIALTESSGTLIERNVFSSHVEWYGISLYASNNSSIIGNSMVNCTPCLRLADSSGNTIYHNNFLYNTIPVALLDSPLNNTWDNGCEGNYWSDYEDRYPNASYDQYGIWNTSYVIDIENVDRYPLRNPYWNIADLNHDLKVDIFDLVSMCPCYCMNWQDYMRHVDIAAPYGVINIFDVATVAINYGKEYTP